MNEMFAKLRATQQNCDAFTVYTVYPFTHTHTHKHTDTHIIEWHDDDIGGDASQDDDAGAHLQGLSPRSTNRATGARLRNVFAYVCCCCRHCAM